MGKIDDKPIEVVNDVFAALDEHEPGDIITVRLQRPRVVDADVGSRTYEVKTLKVKLQEAADQPEASCGCQRWLIWFFETPLRQPERRRCSGGAETWLGPAILCQGEGVSRSEPAQMAHRGATLP